MGQDVHVFPYLYPPPSLLLFSPFSALDYVTARHTVLVVNHLIILALLGVIPLWLLRGSSRTASPTAFALTSVCLFTFHPIAVTLAHGQVNLLLLAALLAFWVLAKAGRPVSASLFLAVAVFLKTYPLLILPMLFTAGRRRECICAAGWIGLGIGISMLVMPSAIWHDWLVNVLPAGGYGETPAGLFSPSVSWNQSLNGYLARAFPESQWSSRMLTYAVAGLVAVTSGIAAWHSARVHSDNLNRPMMVALPAMYLLAPLSWEHHLVYLLPSCLMLIAGRVTLPAAQTLAFYLGSVGSTLLIAMDGLSRLKFYGVVLLWALCIFVAFSRRFELSNEALETDQ
jgi:hypothetical protein